MTKCDKCIWYFHFMLPLQDMDLDLCLKSQKSRDGIMDDMETCSLYEEEK